MLLATSSTHLLHAARDLALARGHGCCDAVHLVWVVLSNDDPAIRRSAGSGPVADLLATLERHLPDKACDLIDAGAAWLRATAGSRHTLTVEDVALALQRQTGICPGRGAVANASSRAAYPLSARAT